VLLFFMMISCVSSAAPIKVSSVTVSQVGAQVITSREVLMSYLLDQWELFTVKEVDAKGNLKQKNKFEKISELPSLGSEQFKKQLALVQLEHLVILEAENFSVGEVTSEDVKKKALLAYENLKDWPDWKKLEFSMVEVESAILRKMRARNFIKYKTESMGIQITESEIKDYYDQNRIKFGAVSFEKIKDNIREYLNQRSVESKMKDWVSILRKKYQVRNLQYEEVK